MGFWLYVWPTFWLVGLGGRRAWWLVGLSGLVACRAAGHVIGFGLGGSGVRGFGARRLV